MVKIMEIPIKMDDLGGSFPTIFGNIPLANYQPTIQPTGIRSSQNGGGTVGRHL